jgi:hypothetical protein
LTAENGSLHPLAILERALVPRGADGRKWAVVVEAPLLAGVPRNVARYLLHAPRHTALAMGLGLARARPDVRVVVLVTPEEILSAPRLWNRLAERALRLVVLVMGAPDVDAARKSRRSHAEAWEIIRSSGLGFAVRVAAADFTSASRTMASAWDQSSLACAVFE